MQAQEPFAEVRKAIEPLTRDRVLLAETSAMLRAFFDEQFTFEMWLGMDNTQRSILAAALAGNFAAHHPEECWEMLHCHMRPKHVSET